MYKQDTRFIQDTGYRYRIHSTQYIHTEYRIQGKDYIVQARYRVYIGYIINAGYNDAQDKGYNSIDTKRTIQDTRYRDTGRYRVHKYKLKLTDFKQCTKYICIREQAVQRFKTLSKIVYIPFISFQCNFIARIQWEPFYNYNLS